MPATLRYIKPTITLSALRNCHAGRPGRQALYWNRIIKNSITPVTGIAFERAVYLMMISPMAAWYSRSKAITSSASALSVKPVKPRRSRKERRYFSTMAFKLLLAPGRNDQISHLRRQEATQSTHALDFTNLVGNTLF